MDGVVVLMLDDLFGIVGCCGEMVCFWMVYCSEPGRQFLIMGFTRQRALE